MWLSVPMLLLSFARYKRIDVDSSHVCPLFIHRHIHMRAHDVALLAGRYLISGNWNTLDLFCLELKISLSLKTFSSPRLLLGQSQLPR